MSAHIGGKEQAHIGLIDRIAFRPGEISRTKAGRNNKYLAHLCFLLSIPDPVVQIIQTVDTALAFVKPLQLFLPADPDLLS